MTLNTLERIEKILHAKKDPSFFLSDPYFIGDFEPYPKQAQLFIDFYNGGYKELDVAGGQGGGKSALGSLFLARDAFEMLVREDPAGDYGLSAHSQVTLYALARSIDQAADTIFGEVTNRMQAPFFQEFEPRIREFDITFKKHPDIVIEAGGAVSAGSLLGRNVKCCIFDEITSWDETLTQRGGWNVYHRLRKSTNRFGFDGHIIAISMAWHNNDIIMTLVRDGKQKPKTMTDIVPTWSMNPTKPLNSPEMQAELEKDPISFWRDYGCEPHSSIESYYPDRSIIQMNSERTNLLELAQLGIFQPKTDTMYIFSADPSISNDNFGLALLHLENDIVIADGLLRLKPTGSRELNPLEIRKLLFDVLKHYSVPFFITDQWYYTEALVSIQTLGVSVLFKPLRKEEHDAVKNAFYEKKLELCYYPEILDEFSNLMVLDSRRLGVVRKGKIDIVDALTRGYWAVRNHLEQKSYVPACVEVI